MNLWWEDNKEGKLYLRAPEELFESAGNALMALVEPLGRDSWSVIWWHTSDRDETRKTATVTGSLEDVKALALCAVRMKWEKLE